MRTSILFAQIVFYSLFAVQLSHAGFFEFETSSNHSSCHKRDFKGIMSCFSPKQPNWHSYEVPNTELCNRAENPKCTFETVKNAFLRNAMPCQVSTHKISSGEILEPKDPVSGCIYSPGHVQVRVHQGRDFFAVSIHTMEDHMLFDGVVLRLLVENRPGVFSIYTRGIGNNVNPAWAKTNNLIGPVIMASQNQRIKDYLYDCFIGRERCN